MMLEEGKIIFKVLLTAPASAKVDISVIDRWANQTKNSVHKIKKGIFKAIQTPADFDRKVVRPTLKTIDAFYKDGPVFKGGLSKEKKLAQTKEKMPESAQRYLKKVRDTFKQQDGVPAKKFKAAVDDGRINYARSQQEYNFPLFGSKKEAVAGLTTLGVMALSGDRRLLKSMKQGYDNIGYIIGREVPCLTSPERLIKFKRELRSQLARLGREIMKSGYDPEITKYNREKLNRLVDGYRLTGFTPFKPGGTSHIDFIVRELADPANRMRNKKRLGLDIQVSLREVHP